MGKKCISAVLLAVVSVALLAGLGGLSAEPVGEQYLYYPGVSGLWQVDRDGAARQLSEALCSVPDNGAVVEVFVHGSSRGVNAPDAVWGIRRDGAVIYEQPLVYDGDVADRPQISPVTMEYGVQVAGGDIYFLLYFRDENCSHLCRVDSNGENFQIFEDFLAAPDPLRTDGRRIYFTQYTEDGRFLVSRLEAETGQAVSLSETTANHISGFWLDGDMLWWQSFDENGSCGLYCVPAEGGETRKIAFAPLDSPDAGSEAMYVHVVNSGKLLYAQTETLCVMDAASGEVQSYAVPFLPKGWVVAAAEWGALLGDDSRATRQWWLLHYDTGELTPVALE